MEQNQHANHNALSLKFRSSRMICSVVDFYLALTFAVLLKLGELGWAQTHPATVTHLAG